MVEGVAKIVMEENDYPGLSEENQVNNLTKILETRADMVEAKIDLVESRIQAKLQLLDIKVENLFDEQTEMMKTLITGKHLRDRYELKEMFFVAKRDNSWGAIKLKM